MAPLSISYGQAEEIMEKFYRRGVRLLIFEGGEPFLWRDGEHDLEDLVQFARQKFFRVGITTNGTLPIETSADIVWVSIDGLEATHQKNRGQCFTKIMANLSASSHPNILAHVTINRLNHNEIEPLIEFLTNRVRGITIQFYYPFPNSADLWLPEPDRIHVLEQLMTMKQQGWPILNSLATLEDLKKNTWKCHDWLIANAEPDGRLNIGCYLKDRADISCDKCGFAAHTEIAKAYDWNWGAIWAGQRTFGFRLM
jgi:MoaA/NifB/PqqE/SkfB family radical SAM enzyme